MLKVSPIMWKKPHAVAGESKLARIALSEVRQFLNRIHRQGEVNHQLARRIQDRADAAYFLLGGKSVQLP